MPKNFTSNYNMVPYGDHGTERVNHKVSCFAETSCVKNARDLSGVQKMFQFNIIHVTLRISGILYC